MSMRIGFLSDMTQLRLALEIAVDDSEPSESELGPCRALRASVARPVRGPDKTRGPKLVTLGILFERAGDKA